MNPIDNTNDELENNIEDTKDNQISEDNNQKDEIIESESEENKKAIDEKSAPKKYKNRTLVVATGIFAVTALSFGIWYSFFNNDVSGVWETNVDVQENDGSTHTEVMKFSFDNTERMSFFENEKSYFSDKEKNSPIAKLINGGMSFSGWYNTSTLESRDILQMYFSAYQDIYSYDYELSGNIFTGRKLKLTNQDEVMEFNQSDKTYTIDPDDAFKPNTGVVGTWEYDEVIYKFTEDGRFVNDTGNYEIEGVYNFGESDDGYDAIIVKYKYNGNIVEVNLPYLLKGNTMTLTINGYEFDLTKLE